MLYVVVGTDHSIRKQKIEMILKESNITLADVVVLDDAAATLDDVLQHASPPLFGNALVAIRGRYLLESAKEAVENILQTLVELPTLIVLEESAISAVSKKMLQTVGAHIELLSTEKKEPKETIFSIANILARGDRKALWLEYRRLLETNAPEAIFGILLWKVRQLSLQGKEKEKYKLLYEKLLNAQAQSRLTKLPFDLALERVLLSK